jgi:hypothetical protein
MVAEITTFLTSAKTAYEIAKGINSLKTEVERNESVSKVLEILLSVQSDALLMQREFQSLLNEKDQLTQRIVKIENWAVTKSQYKLEEISTGSFVYSPNESHPSPDPKHWLCTNCFENKQSKSILQLIKKETGGIDIYHCDGCGSNIKDRSHPKPPPPPLRQKITYW